MNDDKKGILGFLANAWGGLCILPEKALNFLITPMIWITGISAAVIVPVEFYRALKPHDYSNKDVEQKDFLPEGKTEPQKIHKVDFTNRKALDNGKTIYKEVPTNVYTYPDEVNEAEWIKRNIEQQGRTLEPHKLDENSAKYR